MPGYRSAFVPIERGLLRFWRGGHPVGLLSDWNRCGFRVFVDLLLTWDAGMQKPRGEAGRMALITLRNLVAGVRFELTTFRL